MGDAPKSVDDFLRNYDAAEIRIAAEFLSNWLPFLSRGLCHSCTRKLSHGIRSLHTEEDLAVSTPQHQLRDDLDNCSAHSSGSTKDSAENNCEADSHSLGSWKDEADCLSEHSTEVQSMNATSGSSTMPGSSTVKKSWADIAMEDELVLEDGCEVNSRTTSANNFAAGQTLEVEGIKPKVPLSRDQREYIRFSNIQRKKDFRCFEHVKGKLVNIVEGLELHEHVFSAAEQKRIVNFVEELQEQGRNGQLKERTYTAPSKWMRGKGRITLQFGCCYNYATDKNGNPPGILKTETVDPLPDLFKVMIKRLVKWHVLPESCVPDSCIVNIYEEGDCIPPHIDNHDFIRPFCTVSFLSECDILFGSNLKVVGPGEFDGTYAIRLPVGSVLVLNGNGADVAKHCVPAVPSRRISITFRRMDVSKRPFGHAEEPDLLGLQPLWDDADKSKKLGEANGSNRSDGADRSRPHNASRPRRNSRGSAGREDRIYQRRGWTPENPDGRWSVQNRQGHVNRRGPQVPN